MKQKTKSLIEIHIAVLLFGLAGLFGKFLVIPSALIVLGRAFFAAIALGFIIFYFKQDLRLDSKKDYLFLGLLGLILAIHWTTFFYSIQISTVAIGLLTFSTFPVFTTFLEPLIFKEKTKTRDIVIAMVTLLGIFLIIPKFDLGDNLTQGAIWGIISGFTFAVISILNRKYVKKYSSLVISFYQNSTAAIVLLPFIFYTTAVFQAKDILLLMLLGVVFTAISHTLFIRGMIHVKAQLASIIACLEPVYGIIFAMILLGEVPSLKTLIGGVIIISATFIASNDFSKLRKSEDSNN